MRPIYQYLATRNDMYPIGTPGHTDVSARQGYYIDGETADEVRYIMRLKFPKDRSFDVVLWKSPTHTDKILVVMSIER